MIRRLIQLSPSTSVVSLPSSWIKKNNLAKGESLFVEENDNKVVVSVQKQAEKKEATIDIQNISGKLLWTYIDAAYIAGYDSIILLTAGNEQAAQLSKIVTYFPGMIIFEERKGAVYLKDIAQNTQGDLDKVLSRIFNMNLAMLEDGAEAAKSGKLDLLCDMKRRDYSINSYISYCFRQLNKFGYSQWSKTSIMHTYIKLLEMLSDKLCDMMVFMGKKEISPDGKLIAEIKEIYKEMSGIHFKYNQERAVVLNEKVAGLCRHAKSESLSTVYVNDIIHILRSIIELEIQYQI